MNQFNFNQKPSRPTSQAYTKVEPIPVAEVAESNSDSVWGLFEGLTKPAAKPQPTPFAATASAALEPQQALFQPTPFRK